MNDSDWDFHDPLTVNLQRQTRLLLEVIPSGSVHATALQNVTSRAGLLSTLSHHLCQPSLTMVVASKFRPLLLDLCARWLDADSELEGKLEAFGLLIEMHEELFPVMSSFLRRPCFANGPLAFVSASTPVSKIPSSLLHSILLAYYRILRANRFLPIDLLWDLSQISKLFWSPHPDRGVCWLAIRCYALQSGMGDAEREGVEKQVLGEIGSGDCQISYGEDITGIRQEADGWLLPVLELKRIKDARESILDSQDFYSLLEDDDLQLITPSDLSPRIMNIHGILCYHVPAPVKRVSPLIVTPSAIFSLRKLAVHLSLRLPTLMTSSPSAGKSALLNHLAAQLYPTVANQIVTIHLADTSLDPRSLLGSYVSSPTKPGTFEWRDGVLVRAMHEGKWLVLKDIDRGSGEVLGLIAPLVESFNRGQRIGARASIEVPGRGKVKAKESFALFAMRSLEQSRHGKYAPITFLNAHKWSELTIPSPTIRDLQMIMDAKFPRISGSIAQSLISLWQSVKATGTMSSSRAVGLRDLESFCSRVASLLPESYMPIDVDTNDTQSAPSLPKILPNLVLREDIYLEARDVFFGAGATNEASKTQRDSVAATVAEYLGLSPERRDWILQQKTAEFDAEKDVDGRLIAVRAGRTRLLACSADRKMDSHPTRPFTMHKPAVQLLARIATCISLREPVLLIGETGTGKTSLITHVASLLNRPLISLNLSTQTESSDLVGGFRPVDARVPGSELQQRFVELFEKTFSRKKNGKFEDSIRKAVSDTQWKRATKLWTEATRLALEKFRCVEDGGEIVDRRITDKLDNDIPRKRQKTQHPPLRSSESEWTAFGRDVHTFEVQHVHDKGRFSFAFVEGPLVRAIRSGAWVLLDEINLASPETLECISGILQGPTSSITLTEQGSLEPVPRHPDFRLFACMNPATDVGKKDLPSNLRARFTEIDVPSPDADRETLLGIISQYIGHCAVSDKAAILDVAEFYTSTKKLAEARQIADGSNHRPHYSMRTLARALTFTSDTIGLYGLRRALWEGCLMAFTMVLDEPSAEIVSGLARKHLLSVVKNQNSLLSQVPSASQVQHLGPAVQFGPFWLETGPLELDAADDYILTPSVQRKLIDLARITLTRRFPVLIEGPTSSGKTSAVEYLARRTGHRFVRINNHEHTDIQEYIGTYVSDPYTGKLVFQDGLLVRALRRGDWIVLDELNLAPTDVLEALNRLLDDNRELMIPETHEMVRPHPHFMLFATQNPPGVYAGRKILSRAFRNRFLEVHFDDVPQTELEAILCQRCQIAPSYGQRIVSVFRELQHRRQSGRVFEGRHGFATLRDLFRWAQRDTVGYQELAENGYMLLAERARNEDDKQVVKEVIEKIMNVTIHEDTMYNVNNPSLDMSNFLGCPIPSDGQVVWSKAMQRLFVLVARALRFNEPVLLVGETGCGKTSVCQVYADALQRSLYTVNCHQNIEAADLIGGQRPVRHKPSVKANVIREASSVLSAAGVEHSNTDVNRLTSAIEALRKSLPPSSAQAALLIDIEQKLHSSSKLFDWYDGPLVNCMRSGDIFLLDEISLADDSVLERLNSVLEPSRTIVLAERGGDNIENSHIAAVAGFKLIATMNPGGDYGKKELSPALRNRFTEIWVPAVVQRGDLEQIVGSMWQHTKLRPFTVPLLDFAEWLCSRIGDRSVASLRDILAWVSFCNVVYTSADLPLELIFSHGALMTFIDGLASFPQLSGWSQEALRGLREQAIIQLETIVSLPDMNLRLPPTGVSSSHNTLQIGLFAIPRGSQNIGTQLFNLDAPTSQDNAMRVIRACQLHKPILLEGSPGVGKTSLIAALASAAGHRLSRINLSDQTDLVDLFGSDLPVGGSRAGEFAWRDAIFLQALQNGDWVLLDEMNLAPQSVLEGLNAVLDHRGTVYIPELDRSFTRHPNFRIFAAQNPLHQGGGRKGLPKSFVNRFTKVHVEMLSSNDMLLICQHLFPDLPISTLQSMIEFNCRLHDEVTVKRTLGREGSPWEFNLRDVIRWASLLQQNKGESSSTRPEDHVDTVYALSFRQEADRAYVRRLLEDVFGPIDVSMKCRPWPSISTTHFQSGSSILPRKNDSLFTFPIRLLPVQLPLLQAAVSCISQNWLVIVTGPQNSGKTSLVRSLAHLSGRPLRELSLNSATDTTDLLGSFEQVDAEFQTRAILRDVLRLAEECARTISGSQPRPCAQLNALRHAFVRDVSSSSTRELLRIGRDTLDLLPANYIDRVSTLKDAMQSVLTDHSATGRFEWVDGPLVQAMKSGGWLLLDSVNLCNPSVLDRLNSLCEAGGSLVLSEKGDESVPLSPHPDFRLFMIVNPRHGELSRAMRNRGVEIALADVDDRQTLGRLLDAHRLPLTTLDYSISLADRHATFELSRRALLPKCLPLVSTAASWPSSDLLIEDSLCSLLYDYSSFFSQAAYLVETDAMVLFLVRLSLPAYPYHLPRLARSMIATNNAQVVDRFLQVSLCQQTFITQSIAGALRQEYGQMLGESSQIIQSQPLDFFLNPVMFDHRQVLHRHDQKTMRLLIESYVRLVLHEHDMSESLPRGRPAGLVTGSLAVDAGGQMRRGQKEAVDFLSCVVRSIQGVLRLSLEQGKYLVLASLELSTKLLDFASHLKKAVSSSSFDFSTVYVLAGWIQEAFKDPPTVFSEIKDCSVNLNRAVALSSGHGIFDVWAAFFRRSWPAVAQEVVVQLKGITSYTILSSQMEMANRLRSRAFELLAIQTLDEASAPVEDDLRCLLADLSNYAMLSRTDEEAPKVIQHDNSPLLVVELQNLPFLSPLSSANISMEYVQQIQLLIGVASRSYGINLTRLVAYQHALWKIEAGYGRMPELARVHTEWLKALWTETPSVQGSLGGPSILVSPILLHSTLRLCQWDEQSLESCDVYASALNDSAVLALSERRQCSERLQQIIAVLMQSILTICTCFSRSFDETSLGILRNLSLSKELGSPDTVVSLSQVLVQCADSPLRSLICFVLCPALDSLSQTGRTPHQNMYAIGLCWLALSRMILLLYVPDIPIDPTAVQECKVEFWRRQENWIRSQIHLHRALEEQTTGNDSSLAICHLEDELIIIQREIGAQPQTFTNERTKDISRLHAFWAEVRQFMEEVVSQGRIDDLVASLETAAEGSNLREQMIQDSTAGFLQRMTTAYPAYEDMIMPMEMALLQLRFGLRLVFQAVAMRKLPPLHDSIPKIASFPSISVAATLRTVDSSAIIQGTFSLSQSLLLRLSSLAFDSSTGVNLDQLMVEIDAIYEQVTRLWLIDCAKKHENEQLSTSLYRRKRTDDDMVDESELEEREFKLLFPTYEEDDEGDGADLSQSNELGNAHEEQHHDHMSPSRMLQIFTLHAFLFNNSFRPKPTTLWDDNRLQFIEALLAGRLSLPSSMDVTSLPYRLGFLRRKIQDLRRVMDDKDYDFYTEANVTETRKVIPIVGTLRGQLDRLINEWPEQMVLRHLRERCDRLLSQPLDSPVAKVLTGLEQLLMHTEDWERYANRDNSLKVHRQALTLLVVEWRRLELSGWQRLLAIQAKAFTAGMSEWWFRLYDVAVRGSIASSDGEVSPAISAVDDYLEKLIPLLEEFVSHSSLGQFEARIALLRSFESYVGQVAKSKPESAAIALKRTGQVLSSVVRYYDQFSARINASLSDQRATVQKEIVGFIKLASWRDVNVQALQQSARHTHRQLYKSIRKFRDILRQPITSLLRLDEVNKPEESDTPRPLRKLFYLSKDHPNLRSFVKSGTVHSAPFHLSNLSATFAKFTTLLSTEFQALVTPTSATGVEDLSAYIILTVKELASPSPPPGSSASNELKWHKSLLVRKRKAWNDLLKELKRIGIPANVKPDVLRMQSDKRWLMEHPTLISSPRLQSVKAVEKSETYFYRILGALPELRNTLSNHHTDMPTRELQRGVLFLESTLSIALRSRSRLSSALRAQHRLHGIIERLKLLAESDGPFTAEIQSSDAVSAVMDTTCRALDAMEEIISGCDDVMDLTDNPHAISDLVLNHLREFITRTRNNKTELSSLMQNLSLTRLPVLSKDEGAVVQKASKHIDDTISFLQMITEKEPALAHLSKPVHEWLASERLSMPSPIQFEELQEHVDDSRSIIELLLVVAQDLLAQKNQVSHDPSDDSNDPDDHVRNEAVKLEAIARALKFDAINKHLEQFLVHLPGGSKTSLDDAVSQLLPFLNQYAVFLEQHIYIHCCWNKALFKLVHVMCSVMTRISSDGFCKPPDMDDKEDGQGGAEAGEGLGFGQGTGDENVSGQVEDESQVEGLQGEDKENDTARNDDSDDNAIEMSEDVGGTLEDRPDKDSGDEDSQDDDSEVDLDEKLGGGEDSDMPAVDEKLWGDPKEEKKENRPESKIDSSTEKAQVAAGEMGESEKPDNGGQKDAPDPEEDSIPMEDPNDSTASDEGEAPHAEGAPLDHQIPDEEHLDLPDNMDIGDEDEQMEQQGPDDENLGQIEEGLPDEVEDSGSIDSDFPPDNGTKEDAETGRSLDEDETMEDSPHSPSVPHADLKSGEHASAQATAGAEGGEDRVEGEQLGSTTNAIEEPPAEKPSSKDAQRDETKRESEQPSHAPQTEAGASETISSGLQQGHAPSSAYEQPLPNPLRSLGDALREVRKRYAEIQAASDTETTLPTGAEDTKEPTQLEHIQPDTVDSGMQALGPAGEEQVAKLSELNLLDEDEKVNGGDDAMDADVLSQVMPHFPATSTTHESQAQESGEKVERTVPEYQAGPKPRPAGNVLDDNQDDPNMTSLQTSDTLMEDPEEENQEGVEVELRQWRLQGQPETDASNIWRLYESLTHSLSYALCEQLRLILEPTMATRLRGDFRTGKRLNMKKIIPYIASEYTKDKIWLRRTRPSQREYQILVSLDDSRSMAESHSIHLAYETLALVSRALSLLEVGDVAIAKFGETVDILHDFDSGPFTDQAGAKVMSAFHFDQNATNVLSLLEISLRMLAEARERRSIRSTSAAELWQLQIIISDGICQDHEKLRSILRKAEEERVLIVFIIVDALRTAPEGQGGKDTSGVSVLSQNSILQMNQVTYKDVNGRQELQMQRYLDSFPFEYFVVLSSVEALPDVLSGTLKQFFERISED